MIQKTLEYYPNNNLKHIRRIYPTTEISERWYDESGLSHNLNNPDWVWFDNMKKIKTKLYSIHGTFYRKLIWINIIKNI